MQNVITRLNGGLGNQLFQYAAGRALADRLDVPLKIDLSEFETYTLRGYELGKFNINAQIASRREVDNVNIAPSRFKRNCSRIAITLGSTLSRIALKEKSFGYDSLFEKIKRPIYMNGYWQSENYFKSAENHIRQEIFYNSKLDSVSNGILGEIQSATAVSLHIRRGDYVTNPSAAAVHGVCDIDYYYSAIRYIGEQIDNPNFFVFSDDPEWAKDNIKINYPVKFVDSNGPDRGVEDMWLMKSCNHHIIANSSFSWWAAWLNSNLNKIVVAPNNWFRDKTINTQDLIPEQWHRI